MANAQEIAWLAGLIEGEGTFFQRKRADANHAHSWVFALEMADRDIVERACEIWGYGNVKEVKPRGLGKKTRYLWRFEKNRELHALGGALLPWLGERRSKAVRAMITDTATRRNCK